MFIGWKNNIEYEFDVCESNKSNTYCNYSGIIILDTHLSSNRQTQMFCICIGLFIAEAKHKSCDVEITFLIERNNWHEQQSTLAADCRLCKTLQRIWLAQWWRQYNNIVGTVYSIEKLRYYAQLHSNDLSRKLSVVPNFCVFRHILSTMRLWMIDCLVYFNYQNENSGVTFSNIEHIISQSEWIGRHTIWPADHNHVILVIFND